MVKEVIYSSLEAKRDSAKIVIYTKRTMKRG